MIWRNNRCRKARVNVCASTCYVSLIRIRIPALFTDGPEALASLLQEIRADATRIAQSTNQLYFIVKRLLNTPDVRLWATVKILLLHRERRRYLFDDHLLREAMYYLQQS